MSEETAVAHDAEAHRYEIIVDGRLAGFSEYLDTVTDGIAQRILHHTEIGEDFERRGLASILTREAIGLAVADGKRVVPMCPYVKKWLETHNDHTDHVDRVTREHVALFR